jgi:competence protein ComGC
MSRQNKKFCSAFTIFEIVILLCILAIVFAIAVPNFVKEPNTSPANACINNLRQIDGAKQEWALEHHATNGDIVTMNQLTNYLLRGVMPKCPSGGTYTIGKIGQFPICSIGTNSTQPHILQ